MRSLRAFFLRRRALALLVVLAALCMKMAVPAGFMIGEGSQLLTVQVCADAFGGAAERQIILPLRNGGGGDAAGSESGGASAKSECPYAALSMASVAGADPVLLALALAFILLLGFAPVPDRPARRIPHLRPPLRGPPAFS